MKKKILIPVMVIMVVALAGTAMARGGYPGGGPGGPAAIFDQLTPEKQKQVSAVFEKYEDQFQALKSQMWAKRTELNALVDSGNAEKKYITSLVAEMVSLRNKGYELRKQISGEIEQVTGIAMPVRGFGGFDQDNGRMGNGRHHRGERRGGNCWNF